MTQAGSAQKNLEQTSVPFLCCHLSLLWTCLHQQTLILASSNWSMNYDDWNDTNAELKRKKTSLRKTRLGSSRDLKYHEFMETVHLETASKMTQLQSSSICVSLPSSNSWVHLSQGLIIWLRRGESGLEGVRGGYIGYIMLRSARCLMKMQDCIILQ